LFFVAVYCCLLLVVVGLLLLVRSFCCFYCSSFWVGAARPKFLSGRLVLFHIVFT